MFKLFFCFLFFCCQGRGLFSQLFQLFFIFFPGFGCVLYFLFQGLRIVPFLFEPVNLSFDILLDPDAATQRLYLVRGYPTTFLIDREGVIREQHIGLLTGEQLDDYLRALGLEPES